MWKILVLINQPNVGIIRIKIKGLIHSYKCHFICPVNQSLSKQITEETKRELKNENNKLNYNYPNLREAAKEVLRGKFKAIQSYLKKQEKSQVNNLTLYLKQLVKQ